MNVKNCRKCGRLFQYIGGPQMCPACREEMEKKFQEVKKYIMEHRDTSLRTVAEECDVDENQIRQWVREERLVLENGVDAGVTCEVCGTPISSGRFCENCKKSMINDLTAAGRRPEAPVQKTPDRRDNSNRMRFLNS